METSQEETGVSGPGLAPFTWDPFALPAPHFPHSRRTLHLISHLSPLEGSVNTPLGPAPRMSDCKQSPVPPENLNSNRLMLLGTRPHFENCIN